jgi:hypothetical protein
MNIGVAGGPKSGRTSFSVSYPAPSGKAAPNQRHDGIGDGTVRSRGERARNPNHQGIARGEQLARTRETVAGQTT